MSDNDHRWRGIFARRLRRKPSSPPVPYHRPLRLDSLEERCLLAGVVDGILGSSFTALPTSVEVSDQGLAGQWIMRLDLPADVSETTSFGSAAHANRFASRHVAEVASRIAGPAPVRFQVTQAIGRGLYLVSAAPELTKPQVAATLLTVPGVRYVEPNVVVSAADTFPTDPLFSQQWDLHNIGQTGGVTDADIDAPSAWDVTRGSEDVVVAVIDSGVDYLHPDLVDRMWTNPGEVPGNGLDDDGNGIVDDIHGADFLFNDSDPMDVYGHGTHVAGTIAASWGNDTGVVGIAPNVKIMALKFLNDFGSGNLAAAVKALEYMTRMRRDFGINVVVSNNSWGGGTTSQALADAIADAVDAGIFIVAAAGNFGANSEVRPYYPASIPQVGMVSVGSTDHRDHWAINSNYGTISVDLAAPGVQIYSSEPSGEYGLRSGTSMAAPHVSGTAALLKSLYPLATPTQLERAILSSVDLIPAAAGKTVTGGRLNTHRALQSMEFSVLSVSPTPGSALMTRPTEFTLTFTSAVDALTVQAADLTVNGIAADAVQVISDDELLFQFVESPVVLGGLQLIELQAGSVASAEDELLLETFQATFRFDPIPLVAVSYEPADQAIAELPVTELTIQWSEPVDPNSVQATDVIVSKGHATAVQLIDPTTTRFMLSGLTSEGELEWSISAGNVRTMLGNPSQAVAGVMVLDYGVVPLPSPFSMSRVHPLAGEVAQWTGALSSGDTDGFYWEVDAGQSVSMEILTENAQQVNAELLGADLLPVENFVTVIEPNRIVIQGVTRGGQEELRLVLGSTAEGSIDYAVDLRVGQAREIEMPGTTANNSPASAQSLDDVMARWSDDGWMAVLDGSATEAGGSGGGEDWYRFTTESAETISLTMLDEDSLPADSYFELIDAAGAVISRSAPRGDVLELSGYRAEAEETLYIRVVTLVEVESYTFFVQRNVGIESIDTTPAASQVIDADMAWVGNLRYADEFEQEVSGEDADEATDHYRLTLQAADRVTLRTRTPGADTSGTGAPSNTLDPAIRITRPDGFVIGSNDNGAADGMNAELVFTAALSGWYTIEVSATAGEGAYVLEVDGATSPTESFEIVSSSPAAGERLSANQPRELLLRFSDWLDLRTIAPEELFIDGLPGQTMSVVDGKTIRVGLAGVYGDGAHEVALPADRWWSLRGVANDAWQSSFVVDAVGPQVVSFVTGAVNELAAGHLQATITFSEPIDPATVSSQSVQLTGALRGAVALDVLAFDVGTHSLVVAADELGPDVYTLRLSGGIGPIADLVGNALDGEAMGANDGIPSGDGMIGGDFEWSWVVDSETANGSAVELGELARVVPLGSGIRSYRDGNQALHSDTDVDTFTWHSVPGEVNWVVIRPLDPLAVMSAVFVGATEVSYAGRAGESLLIEQVAGLAGEVTLGVTGDRATLYAIDIYQNIQGFATVETQDDVRLELSGSDPELRTFVAAGQANPDEGFYQSQHFTIDLSDHVGSNVTIVWQFERTPTVYGVFEFLEPGASAIVGYQRWGDGYSDIVDDRLQVTNLPIVVAGDYLVRVSMSESIPYRVWGMIDAVPEWGDGRADMRRLNDMPVVSGYVGTAESDVYQVDMVAGQQISLTAMSWHLKEPAMELPEVRPQILLYGPAGELLETSNTMPDGEDRLSYQVMADARYRIEIRGRDVPGEYVLLTELSSVEGDFNGDYYLGCEDLGRLQSAIDAGDTDPEWDVNGDGEVTGTDVLYWVQTLKGTLVGDANLDFAVDVRDLNQWLSHRFTAATSWCDGDFNADGVVDAVDFNLWDAEKFRRA